MPAKKNPRRQNLGLWIAILVVVLVLILPISPWCRVLILVVLAAGFAYYRRGLIYFLMGNRKMVGNKKKNIAPTPEKAWPYYRKAVESNLHPSYVAVVGSTFIQQGDVEYGMLCLDKVISKVPGTELANSAKVAKSMGYWRMNRLEDAIAILDEVHESGYTDKNLYINLGTYLMEAGDFRRAKKILDEARKLGPESPGITDNRGWYDIATGEWNGARKLYKELVEDRTPKFPEAYMHAAQVQIHFGDIESAIDLLERAIGQRFVLTAGAQASVLQEMLERLQDPATRASAVAAIDASAVAVAAGQAPNWGSRPKAAPVVAIVAASEDEEIDDDLGMGTTDEVVEVVDDDFDDDDDFEVTVDEDDDREPNTDLDDEDLIRFQVEDDEDEVEEEVHSTELDDEDEREPNTELDDDDDLYEDDESEKKE